MKTGKAPGAGAALYFALSFAPVLYLLTRVRAGGVALLSARRLGLLENFGFGGQNAALVVRLWT